MTIRSQLFAPSTPAGPVSGHTTALRRSTARFSTPPFSDAGESATRTATTYTSSTRSASARSITSGEAHTVEPSGTPAGPHALHPSPRAEPHLTVARISAAFGTLGVASVIVASTASAHVRVTPETASSGSYATLTFKVPNESASASTTKVSVDLPADHPFGYVGYQPVPGWTAKVATKKLPKPVKAAHGETITEAPTSITWTADAAFSIKPGQFQQFTISAGAMPDPTTLTFPAHQTYSDGKVVNWVDVTRGGAEPEHPAPTVTVTAAASSDDGSSSPVTTAPLGQSHDAEVMRRAQNDTTARWLAAGGIVVGLVGIVAAVWAATRQVAR